MYVVIKDKCAILFLFAFFYFSYIVNFLLLNTLQSNLNKKAKNTHTHTHVNQWITCSILEELGKMMLANANYWVERFQEKKNKRFP